MILMNAVNELCCNTIIKNNTAKYRFIKYIRINRKLSNIEKMIYNDNIFCLLDDTISFFLSINNYNIRMDNIHVKETNMQFIINNIIINYGPKFHSINIIDNNDDIIYTLYENTEIPNMFKERWSILEKEIRKFIINIIKDLANDLARSYKDSGGLNENK